MSSKALVSSSRLLQSLLVFAGAAFYTLGYAINRESSLTVISLFAFLFVIYFLFNKYFSLTHFKHLLCAGIFFRVLLILSVPNLSDDVYRFIWDGRLAANHINPFSRLPAEIMQMHQVTGITKELFNKLNSPGYFTIYPPVLQALFWMAAKIFPSNVYAAIIFFKIIILLFELGNFYLLILLLKKMSLPKHLSLLYILNPLVIIELSGNVHFEGVMIFFVLLSFLLLLSDKFNLSAVCLALGIATKLLPILFVPAIVFRLGWRKGIIFCFVAGITALLLFAFIFDSETLQNLMKSINLFFRSFEFNASIYYLVRELGDAVAGYNIIGYAGPFLSLTAAGIIVFLSFYASKKPGTSFFNTILFGISTWFLFATTVHPWYICMPVAIAVFTPYRYAFVWSFTTTFSYAAYQYSPVAENLWWVGGGYLVLAAYGCWELKTRQRKAQL